MNTIIKQSYENNQKIGILGGTFNPFHNGHLEIGIAAHEQFGLSRILVMPSGDPSSYKDDSSLASAIDRCNMVTEAIRPYPFMELSMMEIEREGQTYTADTLMALKQDFSDIYFIIGADSLFAIRTWYQPAYVMANCHLLVAGRDHSTKQDLEEQRIKLVSEFGATIDFLTLGDIPVSSTAIRENVLVGRAINGMVPQNVETYIKVHGLYQSVKAE